MKKFFVLFIAMFCSVTAFADAPLIWESSQFGKFLTTLGWHLNDGKAYRSLTVDPTAGLGVTASIGSVGVRNNAGIGELWLKTGAADTAWAQAASGPSTDWSLIGNAGTSPGTNFLGTTDAQNLEIHTNGLTQMTFNQTGGWASSQSFAPTDSISQDQYLMRTFLDPTASTTTANNTGVAQSIIYDNANTGFDYGGTISANNTYLEHAGSGVLNQAIVQNGGAYLHNGGVTNGFTGANMGVTVNGATVNNLNVAYNSLGASNATITGSNINSSTANFSGGTAGNSNAYYASMDANTAFAGTQGLALYNGFGAVRDTSYVSGGLYGSAISLNLVDSSLVSNGVYGNNTNIQIQNSAIANSVNGYGVGLAISGTANSGFVNLINTNAQWIDTTVGSNVNIGNFYANVQDNASVSSLTLVNATSDVQGNGLVSGSVLGGYFGPRVRGAAHVDNLYGIQVNPSLSDTATVTNYTVADFNGSVANSASIVNGMRGIQVNLSATSPVSQVSGIDISLSGVTISPSALAAGQQKTGLNINDGVLSANYDYTVPAASTFFQTHYIGGAVRVANGAPVSAFGFGTNLAQTVDFQDNWALDGSGLGYVDVGFVGSISGSVGHTMARWTGALGGAGNPAGAGNLTDAIMFRAAGILPQGGSLAVTNEYGFMADANLSCIAAANCWGFYNDSATSENYMNRLAIGTSTKKVASGIAVDVAGVIKTNASVQFEDPGVGTNVVTMSAPTLASGWTFTLPTTAGTNQYFLQTDGTGNTTWAAASGSGSGVTTLGTLDSVTKSVNGASIISTSLYMQTADPSFAGLVSTSTQTFAGDKTFNGYVNLSYVTASYPLKVDALKNITSSLITLTSDVTGILPVPNGGTGVATITPSAIIMGNGTSPVQQLVGTVTGSVPTWNGTTWLPQTPSASGVTTVGTVDSQSKSANGLVISGPNIYAQSADATFPGLVSTSAQTFAGNKSFLGTMRFPNLTPSLPMLLDASSNVIVNRIDLTSQVTNSLPVVNGGTGQSSYTNGQLLIGNTVGNTLSKSTLTAGTNVTITNGNGSIIIASSASAGGLYVNIQEAPSGAVNGSNTAYTLSQTPTSDAAVKLFLDGTFQRQGTDYSIISASITMTTAPATGQTLDAAYSYGTTGPSQAQETPSGTINGSNVTFTLAQTPTSNAAVSLYQDGLLMRQGTDYTISGTTITMTTAPVVSQTLDAAYTY